MLGRVEVGAWGMIAAIAGVLAVPLIWIGAVALGSPEVLYRLALHAGPGHEATPEVGFESTRRLGVLLLAAGGVLVATSLGGIVALFYWKTPRGRTGPTDAEELRRRGAPDDSRA